MLAFDVVRAVVVAAVAVVVEDVVVVAADDVVVAADDDNDGFVQKREHICDRFVRQLVMLPSLKSNLALALSRLNQTSKPIGHKIDTK